MSVGSTKSKREYIVKWKNCREGVFSEYERVTRERFNDATAITEFERQWYDHFTDRHGVAVEAFVLHEHFSAVCQHFGGHSFVSKARDANKLVLAREGLESSLKRHCPGESIHVE